MFNTKYDSTYLINTPSFLTQNFVFATVNVLHAKGRTMGLTTVPRLLVGEPPNHHYPGRCQE